jgi:hypothetical protein
MTSPCDRAATQSHNVWSRARLTRPHASVHWETKTAHLVSSGMQEAVHRRRRQLSSQHIPQRVTELLLLGFPAAHDTATREVVEEPQISLAAHRARARVCVGCALPPLDSSFTRPVLYSCTACAHAHVLVHERHRERCHREERLRQRRCLRSGWRRHDSDNTASDALTQRRGQMSSEGPRVCRECCSANHALDLARQRSL